MEPENYARSWKGLNAVTTKDSNDTPPLQYPEFLDQTECPTIKNFPIFEHFSNEEMKSAAT